MHEIITLQIGPQANYLGSHFWNAQESYFTYAGEDESPVNHDIHFRSGLGVDGSDTYTPRTVIYDFKANFGALRRINELYDVFGEQAEGTAWSGNTSTQRQPQVAPSPYQESLSLGEDPPAPTLNTVRYWSDYSHTFFHPRSLVQIYDTELPPSDRAFSSWQSGVELFETLSRDEDLIERDLRPFAEESDQMQGLQLWMESESAWAAFGGRYLEAVRDEFGKAPIWTFGLEGTRDGPEELSSRTRRTTNQARTLHHTTPNSTLYIPLTSSPLVVPDYITLRPTHPWHTSALQLTALESATLPTRLKATTNTPITTLDHMAMSLTQGEERNIARLGFEVGGTKRRGELTNGHASPGGQGQEQADERMPPSAAASSYVPLSRLENQTCDLFPQTPLPSSSGRRRGEEDEEHTFTITTTRRGPSSPSSQVNTNHSTNLRFPLPTSFPAIYTLDPPNSKDCPITTTLSTTSSIGTWIKGLERVVCRPTGLGVGVEEREELRDGLIGIAEGYHFGEEGESD